MFKHKPMCYKVTNVKYFILILLPVMYYAKWPVTVSCFPPFSSPDVQLIFILLADNVKFIFEFFL